MTPYPHLFDDSEIGQWCFNCQRTGDKEQAKPKYIQNQKEKSELNPNKVPRSSVFKLGK